MNSIDNKIVVCDIVPEIKKELEDFKDKFDKFTFYTIIKEENIIYLVDTKESFLLFDKCKYNYAVIKEKWKTMIFINELKSKSTRKNSIIPFNSTSHKNEYDFKFKDDFHDKIVTIFIKYYKKDKIDYTSLLCDGPPNEFRWLSWMTIAMCHYNFKFILEIEYTHLLDNTLDKEIDVQIRKDLNRSAPDVIYYQKEENRNKLYNILKAIAIVDHELAYCQGMNILTAYILLVSDGNEIEAFNIIRYIFSINCNVKLREFYLNGFPRLQMYIFLMKEIIKEKLPLIHNKIMLINVPDELWLFKWLQSLFAIVLPFSIVIRLWDCIFSFGIEFILNFSVVFIYYNKEKILLANDIGDFLDCFNISFNSEIEILQFREKIIKKAKKFVISDSLILKLKLKFEKDELLKFNFNHSDKNKSIGLSSTGITDLKTSSPLYNEGKLEIAKFEENLKYISEVNESNIEFDYINDIDQINIEVEEQNKKYDIESSYNKNKLQNKCGLEVFKI